MLQASRQRPEVAVVIDQVALRRSVNDALDRSDRYRAATGATPPDCAAVVTTMAGLREKRAEMSRRREAGCRIVVVLSDDEPFADSDILATADAFVSERTLGSVLPGAILLSAFGLSPIPERFAALAIGV